MPRSPAARRRRLGIWAACCAVLALLAGTVATMAAIRQRDDTLLIVNGWTLTRAEFVDQLGQIAANTGYVSARADSGQPFRVYTPGTRDYDPAFVVEFLNERITFRLAADEVAKRGVLVTEEDRAKARAVIESGLGPTTAATPATADPARAGGSVPPATGASVLDAFGSYRDVLLAGVTNLQVLQRVLGLGRNVSLDEGARLLYDGAKERYANQACGRHLVVKAGTAPVGPHGERTPGTEDEFAAALAAIAAIKAELAGGADFAELARSRSQDGSTKDQGGDLGCAPKGRYSGAFDEAMWNQPIGAVGDPVRSDIGFHLIVVTDRRVRSFEEVLPSLRQAIEAQGQEALAAWLEQATRAATVEVDPAVGRWDAELGTIQPPGGATPLTLVPDGGAPGGTAPTTTTTAAPAVPRADSGPGGPGVPGAGGPP